MMSAIHTIRGKYHPNHARAKEIMATGFLFADPSFLMGMARVFDLAGQIDEYNTSVTPEEADIRASWSDWVVVGQCLRDAFEQVSAEVSGPAENRAHRSGSQHEQMPLALR